LFVAYKWGVKAAATEIELEGNRFYYKGWWSFIIRYICPVAILGIFVYIILTGDYS
jgi:SNF family Na+-dependent transporter